MRGRERGKERRRGDEGRREEEGEEEAPGFSCPPPPWMTQSGSSQNTVTSGRG